MNGRKPEIQVDYFRWLYDQAFGDLDPGSFDSYIHLCGQLHSEPFKDLVPNDDNRAADGMELRNEFMSTLNSMGIEEYTHMASLGPATIFEMLIALSRRADFIAEIGPGRWVRKFLENLGLLMYSDPDFNRVHASLQVRRIIQKFNDRQYTRSGKGGIFPLRRAAEDQRHIEIWAQMSAYMTENRMY